MSEYDDHPVILGLNAGDTIGGPTAIAAVLAASVIDTNRNPELAVDRHLDWSRRAGLRFASCRRINSADTPVSKPT